MVELEVVLIEIHQADLEIVPIVLATTPTTIKDPKIVDTQILIECHHHHVELSKIVIEHNVVVRVAVVQIVVHVHRIYVVEIMLKITQKLLNYGDALRRNT